MPQYETSNQAHLPEQSAGATGDQDASQPKPSDADLEQRAQIAKKDAQAKRKQIPPFVQKLRRYAISAVVYSESQQLTILVSSMNQEIQN